MPHCALTSAASALGFLAPCEVWNFYYTDTEVGDRRCMTFDSQAEAREYAEAEYFEDGAPLVRRCRSWAATPLLLHYWRSRHPDATIDLGMDKQAAAIALIDLNYPEIDGIFWDDVFDPAGLSAPRIGLFQRTVRRLPSSTFQPIEYPTT